MALGDDYYESGLDKRSMFPKSENGHGADENRCSPCGLVVGERQVSLKMTTHRLSKRQSLSTTTVLFSIIPSTDVIQLTLTLKMTSTTTVLFRTTFTRTIKLNLLK